METLKYICFMSPHTFPVILYGIIKNIFEKISIFNYNKMMDIRTRLIKQFEVSSVYIEHFFLFVCHINVVVICDLY